MIFLSHNSRDKPLVEEIAKTLGDVFGQDRVFYDAWSIQPGDGIIDKMNEGLEACEFFFFFVSRNSLSSEMVKLEWQNALMKKNHSSKIKFIPVKIDDCALPSILLQNLYINLFSDGLEVTKRQIIDVIKGSNTYKNQTQEFSNVIGIIDEDGLSTTVEFHAKYFMEPQSKFLIVLKNDQSDFTFNVLTHSMFYHNFSPYIATNNNEALCFSFWVDAPTSPGFPFRIKLIPKGEEKLNIIALAHAKAHDTMQIIPIESKKQ